MGGRLSESAIITVTLHADGTVAAAKWTSLVDRVARHAGARSGRLEPEARRAALTRGLRRLRRAVRRGRHDPLCRRVTARRRVRAVDVIDELLANNERYAETLRRAASRPTSRAARSRSSPAWTRASTSSQRSASSDGDAHVLRNAGGVVTDDVIRSLAISQRLLGHARDRADPPHRLRDAEAERRRLPRRAAGGDRRRARVRDRVVQGPRRQRPAVDPAGRALAVPAAPRPGARLRLRRRHAPAARGQSAGG